VLALARQSLAALPEKSSSKGYQTPALAAADLKPVLIRAAGKVLFSDGVSVVAALDEQAPGPVPGFSSGLNFTRRWNRADR
jgi:hypothetical protein